MPRRVSRVSLGMCLPAREKFNPHRESVVLCGVFVGIDRAFAGVAEGSSGACVVGGEVGQCAECGVVASRALCASSSAVVSEFGFNGREDVGGGGVRGAIS